MKTKRRFTLIWRWSLVTAGAIALFWAVWYLIFNEVPSTQSVFILPPDNIRLPFEISRWWDILIGPIWSSIFILLILRKYETDIKALFSIFWGLSLLLGILSGLAEGLLYLGLYLGVALAFGLFVIAIVIALALAILFTDLFPNSIWPRVKRWLLAK